MTKTPEEKYKCLLSGRVMNTKAPHNCNHGFRKRGLKWDSLVVKENLTSEERPEAGNPITEKTPEEKAREYAMDCTICPTLESQEEIDQSHQEEIERAYLKGYHSSDEELKAYREALKEAINSIDAIYKNYESGHIEGLFNSLTNAWAYCIEAKQLLKEEE